MLTATVIFPSLGVAQTGYMTAGLLLVCHVALMIYQKRIPWIGLAMLAATLGLLMYPRSSEALYTHDSAYQHIEVRTQHNRTQEIRTMLLDGGFASSWDPAQQKSVFGYIRNSVETADLRNKLSAVAGNKKLLVIGAAGFTYPEEMAQRSEVVQIDTVDVDPEVKPIAEKYFLQKELDAKVHFIPQSAR